MNGIAAKARAGDTVAAVALAEDPDAGAAGADGPDAAVALADDAVAAAAGAEDRVSTVTRGIHAIGPVGAGGLDRRRARCAAGKDPRFDAARLGRPAAQFQQRARTC